MQITHNRKADVMYIELSDKKVKSSKPLQGGLVVIDYADDGTVVGFELISPSTYVDNVNSITYLIEEETSFAASTP